MKPLKFIIIGLIIFLAYTGKAQVSVSVNIGSPPQWGPVGYTEVRYYYLPDVEAYYDVQSSVFIYFGDGVWLRRSYLPTRYRSYDLYSGYKVVLNDYRGNSPYDNFKNHKIKYAKGYRDGMQKTIGQNPKKGNFNGKNSSNQNSNKKSAPVNGKKNEGGGHGGGKGKK